MMKMNWIQKTLIACLAVVMILGAPLAFANDDENHKGNKGKSEIKLEFKDVKESANWAGKYIASLASGKVFEGYPDGSFKPNKPLTRVEAVVTAIRLMELKEEAESEETMNISLNFEDAKQIDKHYAWAKGYLALAIEHELIAEVGGEFQPQKPADRLWVAEMLVKAMGLESEAQAKMNAEISFEDADEIPIDLKGYVVIAIEKGIVLGYTNNAFRPNKPVTRAELAAFLDRTRDHIKGIKDYAIKGIVYADVTNDKLFIVKDEQTVELTLDPNAFIFRNGVKVSATALKAGDVVLVRTYNNVVIFVDVLKMAEETTEEISFTVNGQYKSLSLNAQGKMTTITISQVQADLSIQESIYNVSSEVTIIGNLALLVLGQPVELKGSNQLVTSIEIK